jgi:4-hydroxybenzoate polyprenyl transferase
MRGAGCTINDIWDRKFDGQVARTSQRPLAKGTVSPQEAWAFLAAQLGVGCALLSTLTPSAIGLGVAVVPIVIGYPLLKRVTYWPQVALGAAMNWGVLMGWAAAHGLDGLVSDGPVALYCGSILWTLVRPSIPIHPSI